MNQSNRCPDCGTSLPADAPAGVCPMCLLKAGMGDSVEEVGPPHDATLITGPDRSANYRDEPATESDTRQDLELPRLGSKVRYFGDYELLEEIARGGMGVVYKARQVRLNRIVALKMILAGQFAGESDIRRFQTEAESAAQLDHPGIVPIFEVGEHKGHHFFSMGLVEGRSLSHRIADGPLAPREAAKIVRRVAEAIQYAHGKGVIHRDLKPANILLDGAGQPRVSDFGLAKRVQGDSNLTATGQVLGTPGYMPPEQASGHVDRVNESSDIYSLGAVLYAALTGRPPFQADNALDTLKQVLERDPVSPRQLNPNIPPDLETICLKCLQKDPRHRYRTMRELGEELDRFCAGSPILARPVGRIERAWRWCRRNPALAWASGLAVTALLATVVLSIAFAISQSRAADRSSVLLAERYLETGQDLCERGDVARGVLWMTRSLESVPASAPELNRAIRANLGAWANPPAGLKASFRLNNGVSVVAFSADGKTFMTEEGTHTALFWDTDTLKQIGKVEHTRHMSGNTPCKTVAFHPDGKTFATECSDLLAGASAQLWDVATGNVIRRFEIPLKTPGTIDPETLGSATCLVFSRDGKILVTADLNHVVAWEVATGKPLGPVLHGIHTDWIEAVAISPDGSVFATGSRDNTVRLWKTATHEPVGPALAHDSWVRAIAFSPDGRTVLTGSLDGKARLWEVATGELIGTPFALGGQNSNLGGAVAVAFSPDGTRILTAGGHDARYWDAETLQPVGQALRHKNDVFSVAFHPSGNTVLTGSWDSTARLWDVPEAKPSEIVLPHDDPVFSAVFSPDGRLVATASFRDQNNRTAADPYPRSEVRFWDAVSGKPLGDPLPRQLRQERPLKAAFSPDGTMFALLSEFWDFDSSRSRSVVHRWDVATRKPMGNPLIQKVDAGDWGTGGERLDFSADSKTLTAIDRQGLIQVWDVVSGKPVGSPERISRNFPEAISPDGRRRLLGHGNDNTAILTDVATSSEHGWTTLGSLRHEAAVDAVAISPDGSLFLTGSADKTARLWDAVTLRPIGPPLKHADLVRSVAFSPDGQTVLTASFDTTARIWRVPSVPEGDSQRFALWAEVNSGTTLNGTALDVMSAEEWLKRKEQLDRLGGPPLP